LKLIAKTLEGLENILATELQELEAQEIEILNRAVSYIGSQELLYKSNLCLRTALKVLVQIKEFKIKNENDLYDEVKKIPWEDYFNVDETFAIDSVVNSNIFRHANFIALKAKDAIADRFREKYDQRPNVNINDPDLQINVHIREDTVTLSLDSSGQSLHMRGYRRQQVDAPLNEVLAAGLVLLSGWDKHTPLIDPMCGSGTILCEAARIAGNITPQSPDKEFAFKKWKNYDAALWKKVCENAKSKSDLTKIPVLKGFDQLPKAVNAAKSNVEAAGLQNVISIEEEDFFYQEGANNHFLIFNPPYDSRLKESDVLEFYKHIGDKLKLSFSECTAWILSGHMDAMKNVGLRPTAKKKLLNGSIPSLFCKFELYQGSKKQKWKQLYGNQDDNKT
jgi:putative N6-adenine-specific DNA methylase